MRYDFLIDTYETERIKVISAWSMFTDNDLPVRPNAADPRGRSLHEHMVHQCISEDIWFRTMLDIDVGAPPLPKEEVRLQFMRRYEEDSGKRLQRCAAKMRLGGNARPGFSTYEGPGLGWWLAVWPIPPTTVASSLPYFECSAGKSSVITAQPPIRAAWCKITPRRFMPTQLWMLSSKGKPLAAGKPNCPVLGQSPSPNGLMDRVSSMFIFPEQSHRIHNPDASMPVWCGKCPSDESLILRNVAPPKTQSQQNDSIESLT
jgi:hypothetical protein